MKARNLLTMFHSSYDTWYCQHKRPKMGRWAECLHVEFRAVICVSDLGVNLGEVNMRRNAWKNNRSLNKSTGLLYNKQSDIDWWPTWFSPFAPSSFQLLLSFLPSLLFNSGRQSVFPPLTAAAQCITEVQNVTLWKLAPWRVFRHRVKLTFHFPLIK